MNPNNNSNNAMQVRIISNNDNIVRPPWYHFLFNRVDLNMFANLLFKRSQRDQNLIDAQPAKLWIPGKNPIQGRRIVDMKKLGEGLICRSSINSENCGAILSLKDCEYEEQQGLGSILHIRCRKCNAINEVSTDVEVNENGTDRTYMDINEKIVKGSLLIRMRHPELKKFLSYLDLPEMKFETYQKHFQAISLNLLKSRIIRLTNAGFLHQIEDYLNRMTWQNSQASSSGKTNNYSVKIIINTEHLLTSKIYKIHSIANEKRRGNPKKRNKNFKKIHEKVNVHRNDNYKNGGLRIYTGVYTNSKFKKM